ncbi:MAG: DNA adenine methylase [Gemmobacter sp.]
MQIAARRQGLQIAQHSGAVDAGLIGDGRDSDRFRGRAQGRPHILTAIPALVTLRFQLTTRAEFNRLIDTNPDTLTDLERAARFLYLQRTAFGGKISGRNFGVSLDRPGRFNLTTLEPMLEDLHTRLAGVVIECLDFGEFIRRYDSAGTLFYLDPPYWGSEGDYGKALFSRPDFQRLADQLARAQGRWLLSINDVPEIREIFAFARIEEVTTTYTIAGKGRAREPRAELLIHGGAP